MRSFMRFLLFTLAIVSWPSLANLDYDLQSQPQVSEAAQDLANRIDELPDPLFMNTADKRKVNILLSQVLRIQKQQIATFDQQLKTYREKNDAEQWFEVESSYITLNSLNVSKQYLLEQTTTANKERLTGFGPFKYYSVTTAR